MQADSPPRRARVVGYGLVAALLIGGIAQAELWPLSSFRLFSQVRTGRVVSWELAVVTTGRGFLTVAALCLPWDRWWPARRLC